MNRRAVSLSIATLLVIGIIVVIVLSVTGRSGSVDAQGDETGNTDPGSCTHVIVAASSEKAALLTKAASRFNKTNTMVDNNCVHVSVDTKASGAAETALAKGWTPADGRTPTVWSPASSTWVKLLKADTVKLDRTDPVKTGESYDPVSIVKTPLVLAMPQPQAEALGWPKKPIGWKTMAALAANPQGWGSAGHPEWGKFTLGKTSPDLSTSGLAATVGAFIAATGKASDLTPTDLANPAVLKTVTEIEQAAVHYGDTTLTFLTNLQEADSKGKGMTYVSAVAVEEKSVVDYNKGNPSGDIKTENKLPAPTVKLVPIYPEEGTLYSDNPYAVLNMPGVSVTQQKGALAFKDFLLTSEIQTLFTDAGFRTHDGKAGSALASSPYAQTVSVPSLATPEGNTLADIRSIWHNIRKKAHVMLVLDVSGSMSERATNGTKLDDARQAATAALTQLNPEDEVGLSIFTTGLPGRKNYETLVPIGPAKTTGPAITNSLKTLVPLNGTPLYSAVRQSATELRTSMKQDHINAIVVLTDGQNEAADNNLDQLLTDLTKMTDSETPVRVFSIAYGSGADFATLEKISKATGAKAYDARKPGTINDVFTTVISNF